METITQQDRITLKNLKVADFASEETLCFTATVVFDGTPIAEARNDGTVTSVSDGIVKFLKGIKLKAIADRKAYFASLRARQAQPIVILAELPPDEAFALWKQHVLGDKPR